MNDVTFVHGKPAEQGENILDSIRGSDGGENGGEVACDVDPGANR